jgi:hypothetical protein
MFDFDYRKDFELTIAAHAYRMKTFKVGVYPPAILPSKDSLLHCHLAQICMPMMLFQCLPYAVRPNNRYLSTPCEYYFLALPPYCISLVCLLFLGANMLFLEVSIPYFAIPSSRSLSMAFLTDHTLLIFLATSIVDIVVILNLVLPLDSEGAVAAGGDYDDAHVEQEYLRNRRKIAIVH